MNGTREQLAAILVEGHDSLPGPSLSICGTPGDWSVAVTNAGTATPQDTLWLASERRKTQLRCFKSLDAAHAAAVAVHRAAFPLDAGTCAVRIVMINKE